MRTPEHRAHPRAGKKLESELDMHYLSPGAFTVLPLDVERLPDPPPAPSPYRLPTTTRRFKHPSFAILGEATSSGQNSRSSSPTGRVSPFRGHGFKTTGSRHASPSTSPIPPEDPRTRSPSPTKVPASKIPKPRKSSTAAVFGEKVNHVEFRGLTRQGSQSLSSLDERQARRKPPPSPRKKSKGALKQLSPIQGSSPDPSQSESSPSRIPTKSKSTPPSRFASPTREPKVTVKRSRSRPSVVKSRDPSPLTSPMKISANKYQHVQSKINSYNKPKLPPKPKAQPPSSSDLSEDVVESPKRRGKNSFTRTSSRPNLLPKTYMGKPNNYTSDSSDAVEAKPMAKSVGVKVLPTNNASNSPNKGKTATKPVKGTVQQQNVNQTPARTAVNNSKSSDASKKEKTSTDDTSTTESSTKRPSLRGSKLDLAALDSDDGLPSALDVVSSTTNTVTKPLQIETPKLGRAKPVSPMIDGRVLSATSVSQAINKMNDTVLNTQTLIKDSGLQSRLPPAASAIIALRSDSSAKEVVRSSAVEDSGTTTDQPIVANTMRDVTKMGTTEPSSTATADQTAKAAPNSVHTHSSIIKVPDSPQTANNNNNHTNHVTTIGLGNAKAIEREVQNNMSRLLGSMDSSLDGAPAGKMSVNDRIREARTVIAADVKPIKITVREKPSEVEVQSGNVGSHFGIANGINERPSLPPSQLQQPPPEDNASAKENPPPSTCKRFLNSCTKALTCGACLSLGCKACQRFRKSSKNEQVTEETEHAEGAQVGCFKSLTSKLTREAKEQVRINIEDEHGQTENTTLWQKICCKQNKVGDSSSCFPKFGKREESVSVRAASFLESEVQERTKCCSKEGCSSFFRKLFCCGCWKKPEPQPVASRKESMVSSKKKSLTPTSVPPPEEPKPKIDASLVEHSSHMKGAIPVLPVWLAWFCCIMNCLGPGTGTILSGLFCLCIGKPRFSQKDGSKPRIGAFIIDLIIGFSQFFTVLFCLVGWGWSIWWGVIMVKIAKKHKKFKHLEKLEEAAAKPQPLAGLHKRDVERSRP